jgi:hypothetical protein
MMKTKVYYLSNLTIHDLDNALRNDSIGARDNIDTILKEDKGLYTEAELKRQRYFKLTLEEIKLKDLI